MKVVKKLIAAIVLASVCVASAVPAYQPDEGEVTLAGASWGSDFETAKAKAQTTGKPILLFDMVGRLDEKWC